MIEIGGYAGGIMAVIALVTKIINLITAIQSLILRLDILQRDMTRNQENQQAMHGRIEGQDKRIHTLELTTKEIRADVSETNLAVKELVKHVYEQ